MSKPTIFIAGAGGIGQAVALLIAEQNHFDADMYIGDIDLEKASRVVEWVLSSVPTDSHIKPVKMGSSAPDSNLTRAFEESGVLLDCLPGSLAPTMASFAIQYHMHYANLTEYVKETDMIIEMSRNAKTGFVLQTGLAPGYINILGMKLFQDFCERFKVDKIERLAMKVGALTNNAVAPHFYGFTWSPIGVATEYLKDAWVVRNGEKTSVKALSATEGIVLNGVAYEDDFTSGGAADLPDALQAKVKSLDYKTLRYPGHYDWVRQQLNQITSGDKVQQLEEIMLKYIPMVDDDRVVVYASASGQDPNGHFHMIEKTLCIPPLTVGRTTLRAIQATTAAPMVECARMLLEGRWAGPVFQSQIDPNAFLSGPFVKRVYNRN